MMDKQKRIEEMAKHGCYNGCASGLRKFCEEYDGKPCKNMVRIASGLDEQNYRKIPKGAVVITKEQYEEYQDLLKNFDNYLFEYRKFADGCIKDAHKETAKKILTEIGESDILVVQTQEYGEIEVVPMERLKEIIKQKGVEV